MRLLVVWVVWLFSTKNHCLAIPLFRRLITFTSFIIPWCQNTNLVYNSTSLAFYFRTNSKFVIYFTLTLTTIESAIFWLTYTYFIAADAFKVKAIARDTLVYFTIATFYIHFRNLFFFSLWNILTDKIKTIYLDVSWID